MDYFGLSSSSQRDTMAQARLIVEQLIAAQFVRCVADAMHCSGSLLHLAVTQAIGHMQVADRASCGTKPEMRLRDWAELSCSMVQPDAGESAHVTASRTMLQ